MTEARVTLVQDMQFVVDTGSGHALVIDAKPEVGGHDTGPRPMELVAAGLGGCTGMDVISILRKMQQHVTDLEVRISTQNAPEHPKKFEIINVKYTVRGHKLDEEKVRRAIELSEEKYCPAMASLREGAKIVTSFEVIDVHGEKGET